MQLEYMRCFIALCHFRSISKTGTYFHTTPQNISRIVKRMEDDLSVTLIQRTSKGIEVTPQGEAFLEFSKQMIYRYDALRSSFAFEKSHSDQSHFVTLYSQEIANQLFLNDILPRFAEEYPMITVNNVITGYIEGYRNLLVDPQAVGIFVLFEEKLDYTELEIAPFLHSPIVACVNRQHPLAKRSFVRTTDITLYKQVFFVRNNIQSSILSQNADPLSFSDHYVTGSLSTCFSMALNSNYVFCDLLALYLAQSAQVRENLVALPLIDLPDKTMAVLTHPTLPTDSPQKLLRDHILANVSNDILEEYKHT